MKLKSTDRVQIYKIREPVWNGRKVGIDEAKLLEHNIVKILKKDVSGNEIYPHAKYINRDDAMNYPIELAKRNPNIRLRVIPIDELEELEIE